MLLHIGYEHHVSPSEAVIKHSGDLESKQHISVTPGEATLSSGSKQRLVLVETHVGQMVTLSSKTSHASVYLRLLTTVLDGLNRDKDHAVKEVVFSKSKVDVSVIDCNKRQLPPGQRTELNGLLQCTSHIFCHFLIRILGFGHEIHLIQQLPFKELQSFSYSTGRIVRR